MSINTRTLDHLVHLTPPGSLEQVSHHFRRLGFKVVPGGKHAGGLTANALVVLDDGSYIELISFTHPISYYTPGSPERLQRDTHPWTSKSPGWIDFAFLGNGSSISNFLNNRFLEDGIDVQYGPEQHGGRTRQDGRNLNWLISPPQSDMRGVIPFFCGDISPRSLRVPSDPPSNTQHPSTAIGVAYIIILAEASAFEWVSKQLSSLTASTPTTSSKNEATWQLEAFNKETSPNPPLLILKIGVGKEEIIFLNSADPGAGVYEVGFRVKELRTGNEKTPFGKVSWVAETKT